MSRLDPRRLHVSFASGVSPEGPVVPRAYTLTHSDSTGELFLTVGTAYDRRQVSGWYTRLMRDEVLAEWLAGGEVEGGAPTAESPIGDRVAGEGSGEGPVRLDVHCHVSGGLVVGTAGWRDGIFRRHLPMVLEALRYGDRALFVAHPALDRSPVVVRFHSTKRRYDRTEEWGRLGDYRGAAGR